MEMKDTTQITFTKETWKRNSMFDSVEKNCLMEV